MTLQSHLENLSPKQLAGAAAVVVVVIIATVWLVRSGPGPNDNVATDVAVQVGKVRQMDIHSYVLAYGAVEAEPSQSDRPGGGAKLAAPAAGVIFAIPVAEGQSVKAGDIVVRLDDRMTGAAVDKAQQALVFAQQQYDRQKQLLDIGGSSQKAFQSAEQQLASARADLASAHGGLAQTRLASPVDGVVARINVTPGQTVDPSTVVAEIVDLNRLIVTANVPAIEAAALALGQIVNIGRDDAAQPVARGKVSFVSPVVDARTNTALVRIALPKNSTLRPGELVRAQIVSKTDRGALAVPFQSVVKTETASSIYIVRNQIALRKTVKVGPRDGDFTEVAGADIHPGDTVVTTGAYGLPEQTKIHVLPQ